jgi:hypothetical protein
MRFLGQQESSSTRGLEFARHWDSAGFHVVPPVPKQGLRGGCDHHRPLLSTTQATTTASEHEREAEACQRGTMKELSLLLKNDTSQ